MQVSEINTTKELILRQSQDKSFVRPNSYLWIQPDAKHLRYIYSESYRVFKDRLCLGEQYVPQFALYNGTYEVTAGTVVNLFEVIRIMKGRELETKGRLIKEAQDLGDIARKAELKKELPYITHTGVFIPRRNDSLILPGFTYQLDIDKINNADEVLKKIIHDRQLDILIASKSVSGAGVKALLFLKELVFLRNCWNYEQYRTAYHAATDILFTYFKDKYKVAIDTQMKAISQPFFLFYSPDLFIKKTLKQWI